jgi:hypothetical protein
MRRMQMPAPLKRFPTTLPRRCVVAFVRRHMLCVCILPCLGGTSCLYNSARGIAGGSQCPRLHIVGLLRPAGLKLGSLGQDGVGHLGALLNPGIGYLTSITSRLIMTHRRNCLFQNRTKFRTTMLCVESSLYIPAPIFHTNNASA